MAEKPATEPFDINKGAEPGKTAIFPSPPDNVAPGIIDAATYANWLEKAIAPADNPIEAALKALGVDDIRKALGHPPNVFNFGRISYMPDVTANGGVMQWPGLSPDTLKKIAKENVAPQMIIGMRIDDVLRYSNRSSQIWKPGWRIERRDSEIEVQDNHNKDIKEAEDFLEFSNVETKRTEIEKRDQGGYSSFQRFLSAGTRDSLTYDMIALWKDTDSQGKVKGYALLPAGNIRLTNRGGYNQDPNKFAVAIDEGGKVIGTFERDELTCYIRNPRNEPEVGAYGYAEIDIAVRLIANFQNIFNLNGDLFDRNSIPPGILSITGGTVTAIQLDFLNRLMTNIRRGITKFWALPVIGLPGQSKLELLDFSRIKGNEGYFKELLNMLAGALCVLWRFPVTRFGYRISGGAKDSEPLPDSSITKVDEDDPGLSPLLTHWETLINEHLIWSRWPHLAFRFCGKSPKEDARSYQFQHDARSYGEIRKECGLPPLVKLASEELKEVAELIELCPHDPNLSGAFQTIAGAYLKAKMDSQKDEDKKESMITAQRDPARSQSHGHAGGVRRNSSSESHNSS